jgi:hypothetical protein
MWGWSGCVYRDHFGRTATCAVDPHRGAAVARAGINAIKELRLCNSINPLGMFPLGSLRLVCGIARNMGKHLSAKALKLGLGRGQNAKKARARAKGTSEFDHRNIGF